MIKKVKILSADESQVDGWGLAFSQCKDKGIFTTKAQSKKRNTENTC
jgi:hypothetical protein